MTFVEQEFLGDKLGCRPRASGRDFYFWLSEKTIRKARSNTSRKAAAKCSTSISLSLHSASLSHEFR